MRHERLCRFEFPERPGALAQFLEKLGGRWNISLFHYRNHGADFGRVLAGFEVEDADLPAFRAFLDELAIRTRPRTTTRRTSSSSGDRSAGVLLLRPLGRGPVRDHFGAFRPVAD